MTGNAATDQTDQRTIRLEKENKEVLFPLLFELPPPLNFTRSEKITEQELNQSTVIS